MLLEDPKDFGPKCFKVFNHWMEEDGFNKVIEASWASGDYRGSTDIILKNKFKPLKVDIKSWWQDLFEKNKCKKKDIQSRLDEWDAKAEAGILASLDCLKRKEDLRAFESVNWNFLMDTMAQIGFGVKWRKWIYECLSSASDSILINGYLSKEFPMKRGLRQRDPFSHFFIVAESLQVMITDSCNKGLPMGKGKRKIVDWTEVINRFSKRLASWKANLLFIGGRLTLVKSVLRSLPVYFLSLLAGYPGVAGASTLIKAKNTGIFEKWKWRCNNERKALWRKVITEIHGLSGGFDLMVRPRKSSTWYDIVSSCNRIEQLSVPLNNLMVRKIYRGAQTLFWMDNWLKDLGPLKDCYSRLFALEQHKDCLVADRWVLGEDV
uniref:RNA-directed DNA polymerase, eukaryota, reverse transcriptase zinc-binding domain protein n=1 Tax=Tanacetum cinerariifolium TaxID=118510 RepID=A0A699H6S0_TANCI|nr:RNA-directed DNA polymerase, eukaryota, reverse transcriptase zinc-binding domain protein [Tanacetum cinerariifolium]